MSDDAKRSPAALVPMLVVSATLHGPDCPVTKAAREREAGAANDKHGPAKVASDAYRDGWDVLWSGKRPDVGQA